jgi:hypothetical protein
MARRRGLGSHSGGGSLAYELGAVKAREAAGADLVEQGGLGRWLEEQGVD